MRSSTVLAGRYRLGDLIGRGGMAEVYRAEDLTLHRQVAVKVLLDGAGEAPDRARFIAEARTLAMLPHSGLVTVFDAGFGADGPGAEQPFLVMELVEGPTLAQRIAEGPLPVDEVGQMGVQMAEALAFVHARGVVHRDVKPGNVLCGARGRAKLADFGIARLVEQTSRHTRTGHAMGTAAYLAPEQVQGAPVDHAADVYSLGLVLLEALTGQREFTGSTTEAALARLSRTPHVPPDLPPPLPELLERMVRLDPQERPTAAEVAAVLRTGVGRTAPEPTTHPPDAATAPILAVAPDPEPGSTRPLTTPVQQASPAPVRPTSPPPARPPAAPARSAASQRADELLQRLRATPSHVRGALLAFAGLVLLLLVLAVAGGTGSSPDIPDNTPDRLRGPLEELHVAVNGDDG